jgi:hypothetical protein
MSKDDVVNNLRAMGVPVDQLTPPFLEAFCMEMRFREFGREQTANAFDFFRAGYHHGILRASTWRG